MRRFVPLIEHFRDALDVDHAFAEHAHDRVVGVHLVERRVLVTDERRVLLLALKLKRLHDGGDETGKLELELLGVLPTNDVVADECEVIWRSLTARYRVDLFCGWFMNEGGEGLEVSAETLSALGNRGIKLACIRPLLNDMWSVSPALGKNRTQLLGCGVKTCG
jgi:hypothetical protein